MCTEADKTDELAKRRSERITKGKRSESYLEALEKEAIKRRSELEQQRKLRLQKEAQKLGTPSNKGKDPEKENSEESDTESVASTTISEAEEPDNSPPAEKSVNERFVNLNNELYLLLRLY